MLKGDVDTIVGSLLMTDEPGTRQYRWLADGPAGIEVLPGYLYRYRQLDHRSRSVTLQVFAGVGEIGAQLWDQEIKVLLRVASLAHPALPEVLDGGHLDARKITDSLGGQHDSVAYVRTVGDEQLDAGDIEDLALRMHADRVWALRQLWLLADALSILHDARIAHRNLWPGTLQAYWEDDKPALRVNRFEMSALLSNILRTTSVDASGREAVRSLYLAQGPDALRYAPPERLRFLLHEPASGAPGGATDGPGSAEADVFGLGMMAAEWFLGVAGGTGEDPSAVAPTLENFLDLQRRVRSTVRSSTAVPSVLGALLDDMLDPNPSGRPTSAEVLERVGRNYEGIVSVLDGTATAEGPPHLLLYLPETRSNLATWDLLDDPTERDPRAIARVIEQDLRGAVVVESPDGAEPYLTNWKGVAPDKLKQAKWVLVGDRAAWFCRPYERKSRLGRTSEALSTVYVIGYVAVRDKLAPPSRDRLRALTDVPLQRRLGAVQVESDEIAPEVLRQLSEGRPDWKRLFDTVRAPVPLTRRERSFGQALDWLLDYQTAQLAARTYAFRRDPSTPGNGAEVALIWDRVRDRDRRDRLPALHAKLLGDTTSRPAFAHFFAEVSKDEAALSYLRISQESGTGRAAEVRFVRNVGEDTVIVASVSGAEVPEQGLLSPQDDEGTRVALVRQQDARTELLGNRVLVNRLLDPVGIRSDPARWAGAAGQLQGEGAQVVVDMLCHQPMFALQGPPGTGKTEVTSQAVQAYLRDDPRARVLVSAQSHFALDNLAIKILTKLGILDEQGRPQDADFIAIRIYHERSLDRVDKRLHGFQAGEAAVRAVGMIKRRVRDRMDTRVDGLLIRRIAESWLGELQDSRIELAERLRRGANLVFVTCSAATQRTLVDNGAREPFDWVLVEEAAKAWPTELALPLVRGLRWTMVGDDRQIGAYGKVEVERFLDSCMDDPDPTIAGHYERKQEYLDAFELFGTLIAKAPPGPGGQASPIRRLTEQRRMLAPISEAVSRSFYPVPQPARSDAGPDPLPAGLLVTRRPDGASAVTTPGWLAGRALVWLDTDGVHQDEGYWQNRYEADLVAELVRGLRPRPRFTAQHEKADNLGLVVLTPYRRQVEAIRAAAPELEDAVKTVDSFQGREADIVVASLVRDTVRAPGRPLSNVGHLADPSRVNVMLSRARDLLVLVGNFEHFAASDLPAWTSVTRAVERFGVRRPATSWRNDE